MAIFSQRLIQGKGDTFTVTLNASLVGTETLTAVVNTGGTDAALLTLTPTWASGQTANAYTRVEVAYSDANASSLAPDFYVVLVSLADDSAPLAYGLLEVIAAAGESPTYDWLTTPARLLGLVPDLAADATTLADMPRVIGAASDAVRKYCNRWFTRRTRTADFRVAQDGTVRLDDPPINGVSRVAIQRDNAMTIAGSTSAFQLARVAFTTTGDYATGLTVTGLRLTSTASAVTTTTNLLFSTYTTLSALKAAVNAVSGWTASVVSGYESWPTSELVGGEVGQGVLDGGAQLDVYTGDASIERLDQDLGFLYLGGGETRSSLFTPAWGPDWAYWGQLYRRFPSVARVTYDSGFDAVPESVSMATIETVQAAYNRLATDQVVKSETAGDYSYVFKDAVTCLPDSARAALATYRIFNA